MRYAFFLPQGEVIEADNGDFHWCVRGAFAYHRDESRWYRWEVDPVSAPHERWMPVPISLIPAEHRAYILLNP